MRIYIYIIRETLVYLWERERNYLGGSGETISTLADGDVEDELLDLDLPHGVR